MSIAGMFDLKVVVNLIVIVTLLNTIACKKMVGPPDQQILSAKFAKVPVIIDGMLDDKAWQDAVVYSMSIAKDLKSQGKVIKESGNVRLAWDDNYLYIGVWFKDSDIVAEGKEDQMSHYQTGDVLEVFLKPEESTWYWEFYATPLNKKSTYFYPGRGRTPLPSIKEYRCDLKICSMCNGTINNWRDIDQGWSAEMAVPIKALASFGNTFGPGSQWRMLIARYNYSRYLPEVELTMSPQISHTKFDLYEDYGLIKFEPK